MHQAMRNGFVLLEYILSCDGCLFSVFVSAMSFFISLHMSRRLMFCFCFFFFALISILSFEIDATSA